VALSSSISSAWGHAPRQEPMKQGVAAEQLVPCADTRKFPRYYLIQYILVH